nr:replication-relaxation family protein [Amycolatopsis granulosa]
MLWEHRVLTSHQLTALAFPSFRSGRMRLRELWTWGVVDRFQHDRLLRGLYDLRSLFGDKWVPAIVVALRAGPLRRIEVLSTVNSYFIDENWTDKQPVLHDSILARTLKKMRMQGLVFRERSTKSFPPEVEYALNPAVADALRAAEPLIAWTRAHPDLLAQAQEYSRKHGQHGGSSGDEGDDDFPPRPA